MTQGDEVPGDYNLDVCPPPPPPDPPGGGGRGGEESKRIASASATSSGVTSTQSTVDRSQIGKAKVGSTATLVKDSPEDSKRPAEPVIASEIRKDTIGSGKEALRMATTPPPGPSEVKTWRRFVYGLNYIDELVAQVTPETVDPADPNETIPSSVRYGLQDANFNVVGMARACDGELIRQYRYTPYGELTNIEDSTGAEVGDATPLADLETFHGFQGLRLTPLTSYAVYHQRFLYHARSRDLDPVTGRWLQQDPNGQGLGVVSPLAMNGERQNISVSLMLSDQYDDDLNIYSFAMNNPVTQRDPAGLFALLDIVGTQAIQTDLMGQQLNLGASIVDGIKGFALLSYERNAAMDNLLETISSPSDFSQIDNAMRIYDGFQAITLGMFAGKGAIGVGKKMWKKLVRRVGSRKRLLATLRGGLRGFRNLFYFGVLLQISCLTTVPGGPV